MHEETLTTIINSAAHLEELHGIVADLSDFHLHTCLKQLYQDHKENKIATEDAAALKEQFIRAWRSDKESLAAYRKYQAEFNEKIRISEQTGKQLHKADSLRKFAEDAAVILEAVIGEVGLVKLVGCLK